MVLRAEGKHCSPECVDVNRAHAVDVAACEAACEAGGRLDGRVQRWPAVDVVAPVALCIEPTYKLPPLSHGIAFGGV
jgi:hypothetical protein